jgi:hypothetical protein
LSLTDLHTELGFRIDRVVPGSLQYGDVKKCVPGAVGQLNEPEAFLGIEPLDDGIDGRPARSRIFARRASE